MSYCRFSCENWKSDIYCFDDVMGGFTTYVAGNRCVGLTPIPELPIYTPETAGDYFEADKAQMEWLDTCERVPIGLPYDGHTFNDADSQGCLDTLMMLKEAGYNVPKHAIRALMEESEDENPEL